MSHVIWKYALDLTAEPQTIDAPAGRVVHVAMQRDVVTAWLHVDLATDAQPRRFLIVGTGDQTAPGPDEAIHVGTVMDGPFVWHLFELVEASPEDRR